MKRVQEPKLTSATVKEMTQEIDQLPRIVMKVRRTLKGHLAKIYSMQWAADKPQLVSASQAWQAYYLGCLFQQQGASHSFTLIVGDDLCLLAHRQLRGLWRPG